MSTSPYSPDWPQISTSPALAFSSSIFTGMCHCALLIVIISNYMSVCFTRGIYTFVSSYITSNSGASVPEASHKYFKHESSSGQIKGQTYSIPVVCFHITVISGRVVFMTTLLSQCKSASSPRHWEDKVCPEQR